MIGIRYLELEVYEPQKNAVMVVFYRAALAPLGFIDTVIMSDRVGFGTAGNPYFWLHLSEEEKAPAKSMSFAFVANSPKQVDDVYLAALKAGGKSNRAPAIKGGNGPGKGYNASIIDPRGNIFDVVSD